jgi:capsular exopolysaccharide synthesis family protein
MQELFDDRINSPEEAERTMRLPSLGLIPMVEEEGLRVIRDTSVPSLLIDPYRTLRTNINFAAAAGASGEAMRSLVITSSWQAEGKSTTVANLAMALALDNKRVIIVDADLRRPSLYKVFKIDSTPGLTDVLVGTHQLDEVIRPTGVENVTIIPAGSIPPNPAELLGSAAMGHLLPELESRADVILFDTPPVLMCTDGVVLASRANGVLLVVAFGETKKAQTRKALEILGRANANVLGTVLNRVEVSGGGYGYGYSYGYGYGYGYGYRQSTSTERGAGGGRVASSEEGQEKALPETSDRRRNDDED